MQQTTAAKDSSPTRDHLATLLGKSRYGLRYDDEGNDTATKLLPDTGLQCAAAFDPRAILIVKARTAKAVHITEFLTDDVKRRRSPRNNYRIQNATTADGSCIITHDQDTSYAGLTSEEWGAANCRLMNFLLSSGRLARHDVEYYLAYTTKIFDFASKYTWASILAFDQQYREVQAENNLQWGVFAPQLEMQLLQLKPTALPQPRRQPTHIQEECKLFKLHRCPYGSQCRYRHVPAVADKTLLTDDTPSGTASKPKNA